MRSRSSRRRARHHPVGVVEEVEGLLEISGQKGARLRSARRNYLGGPDDPFVPPGVIQRFRIREGSMIRATVAPPQKPSHAPRVVRVLAINDMPPEDHARLPRFEEMVSIDPDEALLLERDDGDVSMRIIDLIAPIGKGQRALFVAPPRTGKTILLQKIGESIRIHHPEIKLIVLLIDERPEEVTDWRRRTHGEVLSSCSDESSGNHVKVAEKVLQKARRLVECGHDVVILLDSLTRLGRAYNLETRSSGRTLSGGIDARTLEKPKAFFGAARNIEGGGSLTVIATALIETGSRMDQVIFEEFKGTGNMELVLSRKLADRRIWPALDINLSGTRKEEKLLAPEILQRVYALRRALNKLDPMKGMELLIEKLSQSSSNAEFLQLMAKR